VERLNLGIKDFCLVAIFEETVFERMGKVSSGLLFFIKLKTQFWMNSF
jgi:hypothetical protein